jgi:hypothetical protein
MNIIHYKLIFEKDFKKLFIEDDSIQLLELKNKLFEKDFTSKNPKIHKKLQFFDLQISDYNTNKSNINNIFNLKITYFNLIFFLYILSIFKFN